MASPISGPLNNPASAAQPGAANENAQTPSAPVSAGADKAHSVAQPIHSGSAATPNITAAPAPAPTSAPPPGAAAAAAAAAGAGAAANADHLLTGKGKRVYPDGRVDEGSFLNGKLHGPGVSKLPDGETREGEFKNGLLNGKGKLTYPKPWVVIEGTFKDGEPHGTCKLFTGMTSRECEYEEGQIVRRGPLYNEYEQRYEGGDSIDFFNWPR